MVPVRESRTAFLSAKDEGVRRVETSLRNSLGGESPLVEVLEGGEMAARRWEVDGEDLGAAAPCETGGGGLLALGGVGERGCWDSRQKTNRKSER